jgi:hypothetical protein
MTTCLQYCDRMHGRVREGQVNVRLPSVLRQSPWLKKVRVWTPKRHAIELETAEASFSTFLLEATMFTMPMFTFGGNALVGSYAYPIASIRVQHPDHELCHRTGYVTQHRAPIASTRVQHPDHELYHRTDDAAQRWLDRSRAQCMCSCQQGFIHNDSMHESQ